LSAQRNVRLVQIGFNRAGTSSIRDYLRRAGLRVADHRIEKGRNRGKLIADVLAANVQAGLPPLFGMEGIDAFTDIESVSRERIVYGHRFFREIAECHPETRFILNLRNRDAWLRSRANFGGYLATCAAFHGISEAEMLSRWFEEWEHHIRAVKAYFAGSERLFLLDVDSPDEVGLADFVGLPTPVPLGRANAAPRGPVSRFLARFAGSPATQLVPQGVRNAIKRI
jgi:hypothetical protein